MRETDVLCVRSQISRAPSFTQANTVALYGDQHRLGTAFCSHTHTHTHTHTRTHCNIKRRDVEVRYTSKRIINEASYAGFFDTLTRKILQRQRSKHRLIRLQFLFIQNLKKNFVRHFANFGMLSLYCASYNNDMFVLLSLD